MRRFLPLLLCAVVALGSTPKKQKHAPPRSIQTQPVIKQDSLPKVRMLRYAQLRDILRLDSGRVVLVNTWATWCKPCREEMPALVRLKRNVDPDDFSLIVLSADEPELLESDVRPMLKKLRVTFPSYLMNEKPETFMSSMNPDWNGALALPTTFLYDKQGKLVDMMVGGKEYEDFRDAVNKLIAK